MRSQWAPGDPESLLSAICFARLILVRWNHWSLMGSAPVFDFTSVVDLDLDLLLGGNPQGRQRYGVQRLDDQITSKLEVWYQTTWTDLVGSHSGRF